MICNSSNRSEPRDARRLSAVCLLSEKSCSQGTEEAWQGGRCAQGLGRVGHVPCKVVIKLGTDLVKKKRNLPATTE